MKAILLTTFALAATSSVASAQMASPPAVVESHTVHAKTVTHNDGKAHRHVTRVTHHTTVKTPTGTATRTVTSTSTTTPK